MKKKYPYLQSPYNVDLNEYDHKNKFFQKIDQMVIQKQYVRITLLDWKENPLKEIEGELSAGGQMSKDGSSSVRRTCQLTCAVSNGDYDIDDATMDFAINKKIYLEFGVENLTGGYLDYPILWFPQGVFFISECSCTTNTTSAVSISLTLRDKMCMLNGEIGGKFQSTTLFDEMDTQLPSGEYVVEKVLVYNIIQELVNHFGEEDLNNIIIEDVPLKLRAIARWMGETPLYLVSQGDDAGYIAQVDQPADDADYITIENGMDAGYTYLDFTYPSELTAQAGETVCDVLDNVKNMLGNYEYFYDEFGIFHFREIKNYIQTTQATTNINSMNKNDYLIEISTGKSSFTFTDDINLASLTSSPKYENIKNDYVVQGKKQPTGSNISYDIRYHLVIDDKPRPPYDTRQNFLIYKDTSTGLNHGAFVMMVDELPEVGNMNLIYGFPYCTVAEHNLSEFKNQLSDLVNNQWKFESTLNEEDVRNEILDMLNEYYPELEDKLCPTLTTYLSLYNDYVMLIVGVNEDDITYDKAIQSHTKQLAESEKVFKAMTPDDSPEYAEAKRIYEVDEAILSRAIEAITADRDALVENLNLNKEQMFGIIDAEIKLINETASDDMPMWTEFVYWNGAAYEIVERVYFGEYQPEDWRVELYVQGLSAKLNGTDQGPYFQELDVIVPMIYDLENKMYYEDAEPYYFLDFIDPSTSGLGQFSVANIGRRRNVSVDDQINCLFAPEIPEVVFIDMGSETANDDFEDMLLQGYKPSKTRTSIYNKLAIGGHANPAFDRIKYDLYLHTNYQKTINATAIPAYYLEPNTRVTIIDGSTNTSGDYMINSVTLPFGPNNLMNFNGSEVFERF